MSTREEAPWLVEAPLRLQEMISRAFWEFAQDNPPWEAHIRYHDEPLWILRQEHNGGVRRIQGAFFAQQEALGLYLIPDRSDLNGEARIKFRRHCQVVLPYEELLKCDSGDIKGQLGHIARCFNTYPV